MGSCISKCRSKNKSKKEDHHIVHDKLVITQSQDPVSIINHPRVNDHRPVSPAPSSVSSASISTFSCSNGQCSTTTSSLSVSSSLSCHSSTALYPKDRTDRSFSDEFLKSCVKENPHVLIGLNQTKKNLENSLVYSRKSVIQEKLSEEMVQDFKKNVENSLVYSRKPIVQEKLSDEIVPRKRARPSSPTGSNPSRGVMRSPSPSRRFAGETNSTNGAKINSCRASSPVISRTNKNISSPSCKKRESWRAQTASPSPNHDLNWRSTAIMSKRDVISQQINAKIDDISIGGVDCNQEMDLILEDIDNPLISLDCFIFL